MDIFESLGVQLLIFSVDTAVGVLLYGSYKWAGRYITSLKDLQSKGVNSHLNSEPGQTSEYVMISGPVKALGQVIPSQNVPNTNGVIQQINITELILKRNASGFWMNFSNRIEGKFNTVPFAIMTGDKAVEVKDVILADKLHLDNIFNHYSPTIDSFTGNLWCFLFGTQRCGIQVTEEMLKEDTVITGIGDLVKAADGTLSLTPPPNQCRLYYLTKAPISILIHELEVRKEVLRGFLIFTGAVATVLSFYIIRRLIREFKKRKNSADIKQRLREGRQSSHANSDVPDNMLCLVCQISVREVILLPCGHFCVCETCSERIGTSCPVCRSHITSRAAAFLS